MRYYQNIAIVIALKTPANQPNIWMKCWMKNACRMKQKIRSGGLGMLDKMLDWFAGALRISVWCNYKDSITNLPNFSNMCRTFATSSFRHLILKFNSFTFKESIQCLLRILDFKVLFFLKQIFQVYSLFLSIFTCKIKKRLFCV